MARLARRFAMIAAVAMAVAMAVVAVGPASGETADSEVLARLADPAFAVRDEAMHALMNEPEMTIDRLARLYELAETPEQHHRLLRVARHAHLRLVAQSAENFAQGPDQRATGAIGIPRDAIAGDQLPQLRVSAVRVSTTFPGFPAHAQLRRDDLILAVDGQALPRTNDPSLTFANFLQMVQVRPPGSEVTLTVRREGKTIEVVLHLAHGAALGQMYQAGRHGAAQLADAWVFNWETVRHQRFAAAALEDEPLQVDWP